MKNELIKLADHLDRKGLYTEADYLDVLIKRSGAEQKCNLDDWSSADCNKKFNEAGVPTQSAWVRANPGWSYFDDKIKKDITEAKEAARKCVQTGTGCEESQNLWINLLEHI